MIPGLIPSDLNVELFADPAQFGKCFFVRAGQTKTFNELHSNLLVTLSLEYEMDKKAQKVLAKMGIPENERLEQYNYCNRGRLDGVADIPVTGKLTHEYVDCGRRGRCIGEGIVCKKDIQGINLTARERECLTHIEKPYKVIKSEMGFKSIASVNSLIKRLRNKTGVNTKSEMSQIARQIGIL